MKTIIVIGASGGIGKSVAENLSENGYSVIATHNGKSLKNTSKNIKTVQLDISRKEEIEKFAKSFDGNSIYALVNCAGIVEYEENSIQEDFGVWDKTIAVNLSSNYYLARLFEDKIEKEGRFIMISSTDSYYGGSITSAYSASKAGVNSLTKSLSLMFRDRKIRVNSVAPGWVDTPMIKGSPEEFYEKLAGSNPLGRIALPTDIAGVIKFLLSEDAAYVNGQVIVVDGGYTNQDPTLILEEELNV